MFKISKPFIFKDKIVFYLKDKSTDSDKGTYKYDAIKRCHPLVWGNMTHDDASVETGVGGQAKYDMMIVFCGNALQKYHNTLKSSTRRYPDCHILHILNR